MKSIIAVIKSLVKCLTCVFIYQICRNFQQRDTNIILIFGRDNGLILDNVKYALLFLAENKEEKWEIYYVTNKFESHAYCDHIGTHHIQPTLSTKTLKLYLKAGIVLVDSIDWSKNGRCHLLKGAHIIQLWHGIPLKEIEYKKAKSFLVKKNIIIKLLYEIFWKITGRFTTVDSLLSTSSFSAKLLGQCIPHKRNLIIGYPRNDVIIKHPTNPLINFNTDKDAVKKINAFAIRGVRVLFYCPTFRDGFRNPIEQHNINLIKINKFLTKMNTVVVIKFHPWIKISNNFANLSNIIILSPQSDVYPILHSASGIVTDYSSIYFDYLLTDKPTIFFPYDIENYNKNEREFLFDYNEYLTGPAFYKVSTLLKHITCKEFDKKQDKFRDRYVKIKKIMHDFEDQNSAYRLFTHIKEINQKKCV